MLQICRCAGCARSLCSHHRTFDVSSLCATIQRFSAAALGHIDAMHDAVVQDIRAYAAQRSDQSKNMNKSKNKDNDKDKSTVQCSPM